MLQDKDGDTLFTLSCSAATTCLCMDRCYRSLQWEDLLRRHAELIHEYVPCSTLFRASKQWRSQGELAECPFDFDVVGGSDSERQGWSEERTQLWESLCFEFIDVLRARPNLWQVLSDFLLQAADADADSWADVASHCKKALAALSSSDSTMEQSLAQTRKRLRIYFVHFRRLCDSTGLEGLGAIRTFPNPVEESSKRTWETAVYHWRRLHTQPCGSGCLG